MMQIGFGGSLGREQFSKIQGEFINETKINWRVKVRVGPMRVGYSTPEKMNDNFIKTSHVMAAMRRKLKANFCVWHLLFTKKFHQPQEASITILPETLQTSFKSCFTLFTSSSSTFRVRSVNWRSIVDGLLKSQTVGEGRLKEFIKISFLTLFLEKILPQVWKKKREKKIDVFKEDRQAFGLLVNKVKTPEEASR